MGDNKDKKDNSFIIEKASYVLQLILAVVFLVMSFKNEAKATSKKKKKKAKKNK